MEDQIKTTDASTLSTKNLVTRVLRTAIRQPIILVSSAALIIGLGLYLNWPAVVTLGLAPLVLTLAPCALMCALGLCAMSGNKDKTDGKPPAQDDEP